MSSGRERLAMRRLWIAGAIMVGFVAAGVAFADLNITENALPLWNNVYTGGTIGAGVDAKFGPKWIGRAEVLYDFYPTESREEYRVSLTAFTARAALIYRLP